MFGRLRRFMLDRLIDHVPSTRAVSVYQLRRLSVTKEHPEFKIERKGNKFILQPNSSSACRSVEKVCSLIQRGAVSVDALESLSLRLSSYHVVEVLKREMDTDAAACFFEWAKEKLRGKLSKSAYTKMIKIFADACRFSDVWRLLDDMSLNSVEIADVTFWTLIKGYCKSGDTTEAVYTLKHMEQYGCKPTTAMCNYVMNVSYNSGCHGKAESLYAQMLALGCVPDCFTHCIRMDNFSKAGDADAACTAFQAMKDQGFKPNAAMYSSLIDCLGRAGNWEAASNLFEDMKANGFDANLIVYSALLHSLAAAGRSDEAHRLFQNMRRAGLEPTVLTYTGLITGLIKGNSVQRNWAFLLELVEVGFSSGPGCDFDPFLYILSSLRKLRKTDLAWVFLKKVKAGGRKIHFNSYSTIFHGFLESCNVEQALELLEELSHLGGRSVEAMYNALISYLGKQGQVDDAFDVLQKMKQSNCVPSVITYTLLIDILGKAGAQPAVEKLLLEMVQHGCSPNNHTFNVILNNLTKAGNVPEAFRVFKGMERPDIFSYNIVINALGKIGKVDAACQLYVEMKSRGCLPDIITYNNMIASLVKAGRKDHALDVLSEMGTSGCFPNDITRMILQKACSGNKAYGDVLEVCSTMMHPGQRASRSA